MGSGFRSRSVVLPTLLSVIASYYVLFAAMGSSIQVLIAESVTMTVFALVAFFGFKSNLWWVVAALAGHGGFDLVHGFFVQNTGVPPWWPPFCAGYDVAAAAFLTALLTSRRVR